MFFGTIKTSFFKVQEQRKAVKGLFLVGFFEYYHLCPAQACVGFFSFTESGTVCHSHKEQLQVSDAGFIGSVHESA